jgi:hypothetical protein
MTENDEYEEQVAVGRYAVGVLATLGDEMARVIYEIGVGGLVHELCLHLQQGTNREEAAMGILMDVENIVGLRKKGILAGAGEDGESGEEKVVDG